MHLAVPPPPRPRRSPPRCSRRPPPRTRPTTSPARWSSAQPARPTGRDLNAVQRSTGVGRARTFAPDTRVLKIRDGESVAETVRELRARPEVATAAPNQIARLASASSPPTAATRARRRAGRRVQWNFLEGAGVNAPDAWQHLLDVGRPGGRGAVVAVLDTGVAYANRGRRFRRSPDFWHGDFVRGYDFVDRDRYPNDENGHGTHVASTIGERTEQRLGRDRPRLRREDHAGPRARRGRRGRQRRHHGRHPLRRPPRRRRHQPLVRVRRRAPPGALLGDPRRPRRAALRVPQGRPRGRRRRQPGAPRDRLPGPQPVHDGGRRHHRARLPGRLLEHRPRARHRRPGRRRGRHRTTRPARPARRPAATSSR